MSTPYENILEIAADDTPGKYPHLDLISKYESANWNVPNYRYDPTHTAGGYYQLTNTNWRSFGPRIGVDLKKYPNAMAAPRAIQAKVANLLFQEQGYAPWANYNPALKSALQRGEGQQGTYDDVLNAAGGQQETGSDPYSDILSIASASPTIRATQTDRRGAYMQQANKARQTDTMEKLARDIEWHFGFSVLAAFSKLPQDKQQRIAELATQYAQADEAKRAKGQQILQSPAWQLANQNLVGVVAGKDIEVRNRPEVQAELDKAFRQGANVFMKLPGWMRPGAETLVQGGAGILDELTGAVRTTIPGMPASIQPGAELLTKRIARNTAAMRQDIADVPHGKLASIGRDVGAGVIEFSPLFLVPSQAPERVFGKIGNVVIRKLAEASPRIAEEAIRGGLYTGVQSLGRDETPEEQLKHAVTGAGQFSLLGLPLPGKKVVTRMLSSAVIVGGGTTLINAASGQPWSDAATQGAIMTVMQQFPELIGKIKVKDAKGNVREATAQDIYDVWTATSERLKTKALPPARDLEGYTGPVGFDPKRVELETGTPVPSGPQTINLPGRQVGRTEVVAPETQGELFTATRPGEPAGREDLPGYTPTPLTLEAYARSKGMDPAEPLTQQFYKEYRQRVDASANQPAATPPKYAQWEKEAREAEDAWNKRKESESFSGSVDAKVQEAIKHARENGPSPEFRAFFGGIEPRLAGTTIKAVAAFAKKLGMKWEPQAGWAAAEKEAGVGTGATATSAGQGATGPSKGGLGPAPAGTAEPAAETTPPRRQTAVGGTPQPQQMEFTLPGAPSETVPIFNSRFEDPQTALVRLQRLRMDPEIWNALSPTDRRSIAKSIAALKEGKTPAQIMEEQGLSSQYPGVIRMSEETAAANLRDLRKQFEELKGKKTRTATEKALMGQLKRAIDILEKQGAGEMKEAPKEKAARPEPLGTTREQLNMTPEQERILNKMRAAEQKGTRGTSTSRPAEGPLSAEEEALAKAVNNYRASKADAGVTPKAEEFAARYESEQKGTSILDRLRNFIKKETGSVPDIDELRAAIKKAADEGEIQDLGDVERPRRSRALEAADEFVAEGRREQELYDRIQRETAEEGDARVRATADRLVGEIMRQEPNLPPTELVNELRDNGISKKEAEAAVKRHQEGAADVIDLTEQDVDFRQKIKDFFKDDEGSFELDPETFQKKVESLKDTISKVADPKKLQELIDALQEVRVRLEKQRDALPADAYDQRWAIRDKWQTVLSLQMDARQEIMSLTMNRIQNNVQQIHTTASQVMGRAADTAKPVVDLGPRQLTDGVKKFLKEDKGEFDPEKFKEKIISIKDLISKSISRKELDDVIAGLEAAQRQVNDKRKYIPLSDINQQTMLHNQWMGLGELLTDAYTRLNRIGGTTVKGEPAKAEPVKTVEQPKRAAARPRKVTDEQLRNLPSAERAALKITPEELQTLEAKAQELGYRGGYNFNNLPLTEAEKLLGKEKIRVLGQNREITIQREAPPYTVTFPREPVAEAPAPERKIKVVKAADRIAQAAKDFVKEEKGSFDPRELRRRMQDLINKNPDATYEEIKRLLTAGATELRHAGVDPRQVIKKMDDLERPGFTVDRPPSTLKRFLDKARFPFMTPLSNLDFKGSWERIGGPLGRHASDAARNAQLSMEAKVLEWQRPINEINALLDRARPADLPKEKFFEQFIDLVEQPYGRKATNPDVQRALEIHDKLTDDWKQYIINSRKELGIEMPADWGITEKGYFRHLFLGDIEMFLKTSTGEDFIGTARTYADAQKQALKILKINPDAQIKVRARNMFGDSRSVPIKGRTRAGSKTVTDIIRGKNKIDKSGIIDLDQHDILADIKGVRTNARQKFLGALLKREGYEGFSKNYIETMEAHAAQLARTQELTKLNHAMQPIMAELRTRGESGLAEHMQSYLDILWGTPSKWEKSFGDVLRETPVLRNYVAQPDFALRGLARKMTVIQTVLKLDWNLRASMVNALDPLTTLWPYTTSREFAALYAEALKPSTRKMLRERGVLTGASKLEGDTVVIGKKYRVPRPFREVSNLNKAIGYLYGIKEGSRKGLTGEALHRNGLNWATKVEFDNSQWNVAPLLNSPAGRVIGQFKGYPLKALENIETLMTRHEGDRRLQLTEGRSVNLSKINRAAKFSAGKVGVGGVKALLSPVKMFVGAAVGYGIVTALSGQLQRLGWKKDDADAAAQKVYYGAPALIGQDLSASVAILDDFYGRTPEEKLVNFFGGPTAGSAISAHKSRNWEEFFSKQTPYTRGVVTAKEMYERGGRASVPAGRGERLELTPFESVMRVLGFTPVKQSIHFEEGGSVKQKTIQKLKDRQRAGERVLPEARQKVKEGKINERDLTEIRKSKFQSDLKQKFNKMQLKQAEEYYQTLTPEQQKEVKQILNMKRRRKGIYVTLPEPQISTSP